MDSQVKCLVHQDEDIILIDITDFSLNRHRTYCIECFKQVQLQNTCPLKKIPEKIAKYNDKIFDEINEEQSKLKKKSQQLIKLLDTLKDQTNKSLDQLIMNLQQQEQLIDTTMTKQKEYYQNLTVEMTNSKLEQIALMLSGNIARTSKLPEFSKNEEGIIIEIAIKLKFLVSEQSNLLKFIQQQHSENAKQFKQESQALVLQNVANRSGEICFLFKREMKFKKNIIHKLQNSKKRFFYQIKSIFNINNFFFNSLINFFLYKFEQINGKFQSQ